MQSVIFHLLLATLIILETDGSPYFIFPQQMLPPIGITY